MLGTPTFPEATEVRIDDDSMWVLLSDGRTIGIPIAWFPRLRSASREALTDFFISPSGIHWITLDEDISVAALLSDRLESLAASKAA